MGYDMIAKVGTLLVELLGRELVPEVILHKSDIGLCSPGERGDFKLGIYLYDIRENQDVRAAGMVNAGLHTQTYPPMYVTLSYMITAYLDSDIKFRAQEEQKILGRVMQVLRDNPVFSQAELGGGVNMPAQIGLMQTGGYEKSDIWNHTNLSPRLSLFYCVQPVEIPSARTKEVSRVRDVDFQMEKDGEATNREGRLRTSLTLLLIDDYTGKPVDGRDVALRVPGQPSPLEKGNGYYVFVNLTQTDIRILCESRIYAPQEKMVQSGTDGDEAVCVMRLMPGPGYPAPKKATGLLGRAEPGTDFFIWKREGEGYRPSQDFDGSESEPGDKISIYNPEGKRLEEKGCYILNTESGEREFFRITGEEGGYYSIDRRLQGKYRRAAARILPVYEVRADDRGEVFALFAGENKSKFDVVCQEKGDEKEKHVSLRPGKIKKVKL